MVGGGPAGATVAALLARKGLSVTLVERDRHPRFHIGESLLPMNMPIVERLGLSEELKAIGLKKLGADFPADNERGYNVFSFDRCLNPTWPFAYQVKREEFDLMLFRHAARSGARTVESAKAGRVALDEAGATVEITVDGVTHSHRTRYFIDASGRDTLLGGQMRLKRRNPEHQSAALFAHFHNVVRRPGEHEGNVSVYRFDHGWIWMIPLRDGCVSVGAVCSPDYLKQRDGSPEDFLMRTLKGVPDVAKRMEKAEIAGNLHATGNYSYSCRRISGPRWLMVGDAYAFVDPIFSTGVYLAMHSAELAADVVEDALNDPRCERYLQRKYEREVRKALVEVRKVPVFCGFFASAESCHYPRSYPLRRWLFTKAPPGTACDSLGRLATTAYQRKAAMGSVKQVDSNRAKGSGPAERRARRARHARPTARASNVPPVKPDIDEILGRLSDAISVVATAANALLGAEEREGSTAGADVGDEITTLLHGVRCIKRAYDALDVAIREVRHE